MAARPMIVAVLVMLITSTAVIAQQEDSFIVHRPDRFRLDLPATWKNKKLIAAIADIMPQTIDELKDREFCTTCRGGFTVRLKLDSINIANLQTPPPIEIGQIPHYTTSFDYSFYAALVVTDTANKPVSMLRLIGTDEVMTYIKQFTLPPQNATYRYQNIYDSRGRVVGRRLVQEAGPMNTATPRISPRSVITESFLLRICERKIFEIKRLLKNINQD